MGQRHWKAWIVGGCIALCPAVATADSFMNSLRIDAHGRFSGVILMNGTEIVLPFDQVARTLRSIRRGESLPQMIDSSGLREMITAEAVRCSSEGAARAARGGGPRTAAETENALLDNLRDLAWQHRWGRVALLLHSEAGSLSGFVMDDGAQVHVVPRMSLALAVLQVGEWVEVIGRGTHNEFGTSMWALRVLRADRSVVFDLERGMGAPERGLAAGGSARALQGPTVGTGTTNP